MNGVGHRRPQRKRGHAPARRDVEVAGDLSDVTVELSDGARVTGAVTTEDGEAVSYASVSLLRVPDGAAGAPAQADERNAGAGADEGGFNVEGLAAGRYFVQPARHHDEPALYVKSVTWNGKDLTREPLELAEGASVEGVRIVYARGPASLRVRAVRVGERGPALHVFVVLVPANVSEWSPHDWRQLSCSTADEGSCVVNAPPGDYRVVALPPKAMREGVEAEVRRRAASAPLVGLRAGETKESEAVVPDR